MPPQLLHVNVGGTLFSLSHSLVAAHPTSLLAVMLHEWRNDALHTRPALYAHVLSLQPLTLFFDRSPFLFQAILHFYQYGRFFVSCPLSPQLAAMLAEEAEFWNVPFTQQQHTNLMGNHDAEQANINITTPVTGSNTTTNVLYNKSPITSPDSMQKRQLFQQSRVSALSSFPPPSASSTSSSSSSSQPASPCPTVQSALSLPLNRDAVALLYTRELSPSVHAPVPNFSREYTGAASILAPSFSRETTAAATTATTANMAFQPASYNHFVRDTTTPTALDRRPSRSLEYERRPSSSSAASASSPPLSSSLAPLTTSSPPSYPLQHQHHHHHQHNTPPAYCLTSPPSQSIMSPPSNATPPHHAITSPLSSDASLASANASANASSNASPKFTTRGYANMQSVDFHASPQRMVAPGPLVKTQSEYVNNNNNNNHASQPPLHPSLSSAHSQQLGTHHLMTQTHHAPPAAIVGAAAAGYKPLEALDFNLALERQPSFPSNSSSSSSSTSSSSSSASSSSSSSSTSSAPSSSASLDATPSSASAFASASASTPPKQSEEKENASSLSSSAPVFATPLIMPDHPSLHKSLSTPLSPSSLSPLIRSPSHGAPHHQISSGNTLSDLAIENMSCFCGAIDRTIAHSLLSTAAKGSYLFRTCGDAAELINGAVNPDLFVLCYMSRQKMFNTKIYRSAAGLSQLRHPAPNQTFTSVQALTTAIIGKHAVPLRKEHDQEHEHEQHDEQQHDDREQQQDNNNSAALAITQPAPQHESNSHAYTDHEPIASPS